MQTAIPNMLAQPDQPLLRCGIASCIGLLCLTLAGCAGNPPPPAGAAATLAARTPTNLPPATRQQRARLRNYFLSWVGVPYQYGGTTRHGIDCSAFVKQAVATTEGVRLPRTSVAQARSGYRIPRSQLHIGDLVFFRIGGGHHVGIYMGDSRFMHASSSVGVTISSLHNNYWQRHFWQARRVLQHHG